MSKNLTLKFLILFILSVFVAQNELLAQTIVADCTTNGASQVTVGNCYTGLSFNQTLGNPAISTCSVTGTNHRDGWVWFNAVSTTTTITFTNTNNRDAAIFVYTGCGSTPVACVNATTAAS